ncbi:MAG: hypothetical protein F6K41_06320 [Symploca sp. SIO3E6]|nr:hypothetical protein [Caldora sp. SIO3E6]
MAAKKQKDISKEVAKLDAKVQDVSQKALDLAKFAEATKSTFDQNTAFTAETSQTIEQASHELQRSIDTNHNEVFEKSQEVYDQLEEKQEGFEKAIAADSSDLTKLNVLKKEVEATGVSSSDIDRAGESKQEEINFLSASTEHIETVQDELKKKLDESRQRRQAARLNYKSKSLHNPTQFVDAHEHTGNSSRERGGDSHTEYEPPLDSQVEDDQSSSERVAKEKAQKEAAEKAAKVVADQEITAFNLKGGHGHIRHGYQTTREEQQTRLLTGITPDGDYFPTGETSRFLDAQSEALAIKKAEVILNNLPLPGQDIPKSLAKGFSIKKRSGRISFFVEARTELNSFGETGKIITRNPDTFDWQDIDEVIFIFEPNETKNGWSLVTYFPKKHQLI